MNALYEFHEFRRQGRLSGSSDNHRIIGWQSYFGKGCNPLLLPDVDFASVHVWSGTFGFLTECGKEPNKVPADTYCGLQPFLAKLKKNIFV